jgi:hypothetical protein
MTTTDKRPFNSHDDPVVVDNGPFRLDLRGKKKSADQSSTISREFTFFSQLLVATIKSDDLPEPPELLRLRRTVSLEFHLKDNSANAKVTLEWKKGGNDDEPYENTLIVKTSDIELEPDGKGRLKAKSNHKDLRVVSIAQGGTTIWTRPQGNSMFLSALIPESEP